MKEKWRYLYRAIDRDSTTFDIQLLKTRNHQAAYTFMKRLVKTNGSHNRQDASFTLRIQKMTKI